MSNYKATRDEYAGSQSTETSITRVGGATDGVQAQSMKVTTNAQATYLTPYRELPLAIWNDVTGADVSVTVYGTVNSASLPLNDEIWLECQYLGDVPVAKLQSSTKASNVMVSNDGLTITHTDTITNAGARFVQALSSGKYYFEATLGGVTTSTTDYVGLLASTGTYTNIATDATNCLATYRSGGNIWSNNVNSGKTLGSYATGNTIGVAVDLTARLGWMRIGSGNWNGDAAANPVTGVGGVTIGPGDFGPVVGFGTSLNTTWTVNFGATSYVGSAPSGFGNWPAPIVGSSLASFKSTSKSHPLATGAAVASDVSTWNGGGSGAGWSPFKLTATLTAPQPQQRGYIYARILAAKPSTTYYIDPQLNLSSTGGSITGPMSNKVTRDEYAGGQITETSITRSGGAVAGTSTTPISTKIATNAQATFLTPYRALRLAAWNDVTGAGRTVTVCGTINSASLPTNAEIWMDVQYLGNASSPIASFKTTAKSHPLATAANVSSDSSTWNGGGSGAGWSPFKLTATLTAPQPQQKGFIYASIRAAKPSTTYYIDPLITLS